MICNVSENWVEYTRRILESDSDNTSKDLYDAFVRYGSKFAGDFKCNSMRRLLMSNNPRIVFFSEIVS